jgi:hypothetical protein
MSPVTTDMSFNTWQPLRARRRFALDNTLLYFTGGLAAVDTEFRAVVVHGPDSAQRNGSTVGPPALVLSTLLQTSSGRIEYLYVGLH